jgi:hypothetical protein
MYRVIDNPQKLTDDEWQRVVAVFAQVGRMGRDRVIHLPGSVVAIQKLENVQWRSGFAVPAHVCVPLEIR